jgi:IS30 family transposase
MEKTQRQIAGQIKVNQSAISRKIARNSDVSGYIFNVADEKAIKRRSSASKVPNINMSKQIGRREALCVQRSC